MTVFGQMRFHRGHIGASERNMIIRAMHVDCWRFGRFIFRQMHYIVIANIQPITVSCACHSLTYREANDVAIKVSQLLHGVAVCAEINVVDFSGWQV